MPQKLVKKKLTLSRKMAFYGKRTMLVCDPMQLAEKYRESPTWDNIRSVPREVSDAVALGDDAAQSICAFDVMHRSARHVHRGHTSETHVLDTVVVKRSAASLLEEATLHALAYEACPSGVSRPIAYVTARGCESSALVMERCGEDGFQFMRSKPPPSECVEWLSQVVAAVSRMHTANIIHGDLKLNNTCLLGGQWRVIDFGLALEHSHKLLTPDFIYNLEQENDEVMDRVPFNTSFDLRVLIWSCVLHARSEGPWDAWLSRFQCNYPDAWDLRTLALRAAQPLRAKLMRRALHAMYAPVFSVHDAEFEPLRVLNTMEMWAETHGLLLADAPGR